LIHISLRLKTLDVCEYVGPRRNQTYLIAETLKPVKIQRNVCHNL